MAKRKLSAEALEFFRRAGKRSAKARMEKLTPEQRKEVAKKAAAARWEGHNKKAKQKSRRESVASKQATP